MFLKSKLKNSTLILKLDQHYNYLFYLFKYNIQINNMVKHILTHKNIPLEPYKNYESHYNKNNIIPINTYYKLFNVPYYKNSPYSYRDIHVPTDFYNLLNNKYISKPISNKVYNIGRYYNPDIKTKTYVKDEILPIKVDKYNTIDNCFHIQEIVFYSKKEHNFNSTLRIFKDFDKDPFFEQVFFVLSLEVFYEYSKYTYIPYHKQIISKCDNLSIDLSDFGFKHIINDNYMKKFFSINYSYN